MCHNGDDNKWNGTAYIYIHDIRVSRFSFVDCSHWMSFRRLLSLYFFAENFLVGTIMTRTPTIHLKCVRNAPCSIEACTPQCFMFTQQDIVFAFWTPAGSIIRCVKRDIAIRGRGVGGGVDDGGDVGWQWKDSMNPVLGPVDTWRLTCI